MKKKICSSCGIECFLWKSTPKLCKSCALKNSTPIGTFTMTSNKTLQTPKNIKPISKQSDKEKKRQTAYSALRKVYMEQHPKCMFKDCQRPSTECHHIRGRLGDYLLDTSEWMAVCNEHHVHIHNNDKESRELGYLKSRLGK